LEKIKYRRIRDIPGSKTILIAMAWGVVTAVLPTLSESARVSWTTVVIFLWSAGIVFARTAFFDILDMQGDRIVGKETIPILLGEKRSMRLLKIILSAVIAMLTLLAAFQLISSLGFVLTICPIVMLLILSTYERGVILASIKLEMLVETNFIVAGIVAFVWTLLIS
jgi:4-hydroxybenzoate polyprenyltransferase